MANLRDTAVWGSAHLAHWIILYLAFAKGIDGAMNLLSFWVWFFAALSLSLLRGDAVLSSAQRPERPARAALGTLQAWTTLALLVWFGHIPTAAAWALSMLLVAVHRVLAREARGKISTEVK